MQKKNAPFANQPKPERMQDYASLQLTVKAEYYSPTR
jgi:hypothetical protein